MKTLWHYTRDEIDVATMKSLFAILPTDITVLFERVNDNEWWCILDLTTGIEDANYWSAWQYHTDPEKAMRDAVFILYDSFESYETARKESAIETGLPYEPTPIPEWQR